MKNIVSKLMVFITYLLLMLWIIDFNFKFIIDLKLLSLVFFGTAILSLASVKKEMHKLEYIHIVKWNSQLTALLSTILLLLIFFAEDRYKENFVYNLCLNLRPILYGFFIYILADIFDEKKKATLLIDKDSQQYKNIYLTFKDLSFTDREAEIAQELLTDLSNKEIGEKLYIAESTVKKHIKNIYKKAIVNSREDFKDKFSL